MRVPRKLYQETCGLMCSFYDVVLQVVYSPHVYGPSTPDDPQLQVASFPLNLMARWKAQWNYLSTALPVVATTPPVVVGAWGGAALDANKPWFEALVAHLRDAQNNLAGSFYMQYNPGEDEGGLLLSWKGRHSGERGPTPNRGRLDLHSVLDATIVPPSDVRWRQLVPLPPAPPPPPTPSAPAAWTPPQPPPPVQVVRANGRPAGGRIRNPAAASQAGRGAGRGTGWRRGAGRGAPDHSPPPPSMADAATTAGGATRGSTSAQLVTRGLQLLLLLILLVVAAACALAEPQARRSACRSVLPRLRGWGAVSSADLADAPPHAASSLAPQVEEPPHATLDGVCDPPLIYPPCDPLTTYTCRNLTCAHLTLVCARLSLGVELGGAKDASVQPP